MELQELTQAIKNFRDERDWRQYHHPKDLAVALSIEAAEVLEIFRFKSAAQIDAELPELKKALGHELADCLYFILLMASDCGIDMKQALQQKMAENAKKYPVERCRGKNLKYTEL
ncbi:MAG: nucleotide pyrophosphohydrolase [Candidatus Eremiobacteraeota bacterium]|nr:nucleotide pyrophosphohydrolase [Candidatus Eremiobacteraeota bacterium]MCW5870008.1 nucleotide pyrophosphohydrolase [Candidatus Eremiobacteraeota bacterium]